MMTVAIECVYACQRESQLPWAIAILECLPERESGSSKALSKLHDQADALEAHLNAAELLSNHGVNVMPCQLREMQDEEEKVRDVLTKLTRTAAKRTPRLSDEDWRRLLYDTLELQQKVFTCLEPQVCIQKVTEALLCSALPDNIRLAGELLETRADRSPVNNPYLQQLPFAQSVQLVTTAARQYYNSSESHADDAINLALQCLSLVECEHEDIQKEKDLIAALQILPDFGIHKLPLQVRLCEDRLSLVEECLATKQGSYRHCSLLQHLAGLLRVCGTNTRARQAKVLTLIAQAALKAEDYAVASGVCEQVVSGEHEEGWAVCEALGRTHRFTDLAARARFLDFALTYATPSHLEDLLNARNEVEMAVLYAKVNMQMEQQDNTGDSEEAFVDAHAEQVEDEEEEEEEEEDFYDGEEDEGVLRRRKSSLLRGTLGMTRSVLSATASTTSTLVSNVASKHFWRSAVSWIQPLVELSTEVEERQHLQDTNSDFLLQGVHAFYADLLPEHHISTLGASYQSYGTPTHTQPALEFSLALLRMALIEETLTQGATIKANKTVVAEAARAVLREDMVLGLLLLLMLQDAQDAREVLATLPRTDVSLQVSQYYYALQVYSRLHPWPCPGIAPVFLHDPAQVIATVTHMLDSPATGELSGEVKPFVEVFRATQRLVEDYVQGQALQRLGTGVDINRFLSDTSYKEDTVLGLAMTVDEEVLDLALALARKYEVSLWQVNMTHLQHLFDADLSTAQVRQHIAARDLVSMLSEKPREFLTRMEQNVFMTVDGRDHDRLLLYYSLLEQCAGREPEAKLATSHIRLLKKLRGSAEGLNYKMLLRPDSDALEILRPVLTASNVNNLAKVARSVPCREGATLEPSTVYCAWAQKFFFEVPPDKKLKTCSDWIHRYEACGEYLQKMNAPDALKFVQQLVLSNDGALQLPLEARGEVTRRALKFCRQQQNKQKLAEDGRVWEEAAATLERWGGHLDLLRSSTFLHLQQSKDPRLRDYAARFAQTGGDEARLREVACAVLLEGCRLEVLREVLAVFPEHVSTTPEDVIMDTLRLLLAGWREKTAEVKLLREDSSPVSSLNHLLQQVREYLEEGGELLSEEEVLEEVRSLCEDDCVTLEAKVEVLTVAEKHLSLSEEDLQLVRVMRTGGLVAGAWPGEVVGQGQLANSEARSALLSSLTALTATHTQAKALLELLHLWPRFNTEEYASVTSNPWLKVFHKTLEVTQDDPEPGLQVIWEAAQQAHLLQQLPRESLTTLAHRLRGLGRVGLRCCCKVSLLSREAEDHAAVLESVAALQEVRDTDYDGALLSEMVSHELVAPLLTTPLYGPLVTHLVEAEDPEMLRSAVKQLEAAGHHREAAGLACARSPLPKALQTVSSVLQTYRKWL